MSMRLEVIQHSSIGYWVIYQGERIGTILVHDHTRPEDYQVHFVAPTGEEFRFPNRRNMTRTLADLLCAAAEFDYTAHPVLLRSNRSAKIGWVTVHCPTCDHYGGLSGTSYPTVAEAMDNLSFDHWKVVGLSARIVTEKLILPAAPRPVLAEEPRGVARAG